MIQTDVEDVAHDSRDAKPSLGKALLKARTNKKLTQSDVASSLNLNKSVIIALENDEPIEGVSATYLRGYQRAYIRLLNLDEQRLMGELETISPPKPPPALVGTKGTSLHILDKHHARRGRLLNVMVSPWLIFLLILIGLVVFYWPRLLTLVGMDKAEQATQSPLSQDADTQTEVILKLVENPKPLPGVTSASNDTAEDQADSVTLKINQADSITATKDKDEITTVETSVVPAGGDSTKVESSDNEQNPPADDESDLNGKQETQIQDNTEQAENNPQDDEAEDRAASALSQQSHSKITLIAEGESWLDVRDAENTRLFRNILKLDQITVTGVLPLTIRTGNLQALRLKINQGEQQKVDVFDETTSVASFLVEKDASGQLKFTGL